jgi:hypothetical protein
VNFCAILRKKIRVRWLQSRKKVGVERDKPWVVCNMALIVQAMNLREQGNVSSSLVCVCLPQVRRSAVLALDGS